MLFLFVAIGKGEHVFRHFDRHEIEHISDESPFNGVLAECYFDTLTDCGG